VEITPEQIDYHSVIEDVVQSMGPLAEQRGLALTAHLPDEDCFAIADKRALGQILINLVHNAIKFTSEGEVRIELSRQSAEDQWTLTVSDTGPGIADDEQARIFGAFERSASARKHFDEGTGLGLYISHKLAELMGFHISVRSTPGAGSTFFVVPAK
jgi:signal transduction histidine kinase